MSKLPPLVHKAESLITDGTYVLNCKQCRLKFVSYGSSLCSRCIGGKCNGRSGNSSTA